MSQLFDCWCMSENVENNHDRLRELILIEEFKNCLSNDVGTFVNVNESTLNEEVELRYG